MKNVFAKDEYVKREKPTGKHTREKKTQKSKQTTDLEKKISKSLMQITDFRINLFKI